MWKEIVFGHVSVVMVSSLLKQIVPMLKRLGHERPGRESFCGAEGGVFRHGFIASGLDFFKRRDDLCVLFWVLFLQYTFCFGMLLDEQ